jgi:hypothetical protein
VTDLRIAPDGLSRSEALAHCLRETEEVALDLRSGSGAVAMVVGGIFELTWPRNSSGSENSKNAQLS